MSTQNDRRRRYAYCKIIWVALVVGGGLAVSACFVTSASYRIWAIGEAVLLIPALILLWEAIMARGDVPKITQLQENALLTRSELYQTTIQLIAHSENSSWNRVYNYLMGASIVMLTWATVFVSNKEQQTGMDGTLLATSSLGLAISLAWAPFGLRGRRYLTRYMEIARRLENRAGPITAGDGNEFSWMERKFRSQYMAVVVPLLFAAVFWWMLVASIERILGPF